MVSLKDPEKNSKIVFKPLLEDPFPQVQFPVVPQEIYHEILEFLLLLLQEVGNWYKLPSELKIKSPELLKYLTLGFNSTVKSLENQAKLNFKGKTKKLANKQNANKFIKYVFVCKSDIKPPLLIQQFPVLCCTASGEEKVKLVQLPRDSLFQIETVLGQKRGIIGLAYNDFISQRFKDILNQVPDIYIHWLDKFKFNRLNVKMIRTTAPIERKKKVTKKSTIKSAKADLKTKTVTGT